MQGFRYFLLPRVSWALPRVCCKPFVLMGEASERPNALPSFKDIRQKWRHPFQPTASAHGTVKSPGLALRNRQERKARMTVQVWTRGRNVRRAFGPEAH